jgi:hypothetical protein
MLILLWSTNPLSIYAQQKTIIEGTVYYDAKKDEAKRVAVNQERNLIIGQMLEEKNKGMNTQEPKKKLRLNTTVIHGRK